MRWRLVVTTVVVLSTGCSLDTSATLGAAMTGATDSGGDGAAGDGGSVPDAGDSAMGLDVSVVPDAEPRDTGTDDTGGMDSGPADTGPVDTGAPDTGPSNCASTYGGAPAYMECAERPTECEFYTDLGGSETSCDAMCRRFGGTCLRGYRESEATAASCAYYTGDARSCFDSHDDEICVCSR
ncbi:MAG: hypothetical protein DRJ42_08090 [Deltaproteobacteria bacterium]|nr:MAG: hypothetical protein DRJ42_08090 [Deltaproteobacteria bacterium]